MVGYRVCGSESKSAHGSDVHFKWNPLSSSLNHSGWMFHLEDLDCRMHLCSLPQTAAWVRAALAALGKGSPTRFSGLQSNCLVLTHTELCLQQEEVAGLLQCLRVDWRQEVSVLNLKHSHLV